jgi:glycosyltransferase involved in cell wall biosynthesis
VKILYVIGTLDVGGTEGQLVKLAMGLDTRRFAPTVCSLSSGGPYLEVLAAAGIPVEIIGFRGFRRGSQILRHPHKVAAQLMQLLRFVRRVEPAIVHGFLFWAYVLGTYAARAAGVPIVIASRRSLGHFKADKPHYLILERLANGMTDLIVANSEAVKQDVVRRERVEPSKVRVIHNGIDPSTYQAAVDSPRLRASLGIPEEAKIVGVVANLIPYKGHRVFLSACQEVRRRHSPAKILLIGDGPARGELEALAQVLGLQGDVLFLGGRRDVSQLLALMDLAVLPSLEEGFPNAVLEAMAAGKAVVATRVGGVPEAVVHGETGLLVPPGEPGALAEAISELLSHPQRAAEMGMSGKERVTKQFGLDRMVRETQGVYEELLATKGRLGY